MSVTAIQPDRLGGFYSSIRGPDAINKSASILVTVTKLFICVGRDAPKYLYEHKIYVTSLLGFNKYGNGPNSIMLFSDILYKLVMEQKADRNWRLTEA